MLIFVISDSCVILRSFSFSQLPRQVLDFLGSNQGIRLQPPRCQGSVMSLSLLCSHLWVLVLSGLASDPAPLLPGFC